MAMGKKTKNSVTGGSGPKPAIFGNGNSSFRSLTKGQIGGVIFGCKNDTITECLSKQLFGLPGPHFTYVKNIYPGLSLFLFNYSDRKLHGIFEAASSGQMNINPYGWTTDGSEKTYFPAQVQIRVRRQCQPLSEEQFKPIIVDNYYSQTHFWFELDHAQTRKLLSLLSSLTIAPSASLPHSQIKFKTIFKPFPSLKKEEVDGSKPVALEVAHSNLSRSDLEKVELAFSGDYMIEEQSDAKINEQDEKDLIYKRLQELALVCGIQDISTRDDTKSSGAINGMHLEVNGSGDAGNQKHLEKNGEELCTSSDCQSIRAQLVQGMEELRAFKAEQTLKMGYLEQKLVEAEKQIQQLKDHCMMLESMCRSSTKDIDERTTESSDELHLDPTESIYLIGGSVGESWSSSMDSYFPTPDVIRSLTPMSSVRSYASVAKWNNEIFIFGGGNGYSWYETAESYNSAKDKWCPRPSLTRKKGSLAGATLNDKIFAIGGGDGAECFSDVEMLDLDVGRWIPTRSMLQKRFALAGVELNGALYATGGYDGNDYLKTAERFDPREHSWTKIASMNTKRGCHSLVVLNEKLYALGGFDGNSMTPSTEIFDPRLGSWINGEPMNKPRGYFGAAVVNGAIHVIGGVHSDENMTDTVEYFKEGKWQEKTTKAIGKRCFLSAIVL